MKACRATIFDAFCVWRCIMSKFTYENTQNVSTVYYGDASFLSDSNIWKKLCQCDINYGPKRVVGQAGAGRARVGRGSILEVPRFHFMLLTKESLDNRTSILG